MIALGRQMPHLSNKGTSECLFSPAVLCLLGGAATAPIWRPAPRTTQLPVRNGRTSITARVRESVSRLSLFRKKVIILRECRQQKKNKQVNLFFFHRDNTLGQGRALLSLVMIGDGC